MEHTHIEKQLGVVFPVSIVELFTSLLEHAISIGASDIHIDPRSEQVKVRMRVDGVLHDSFSLPKEVHLEIISRIKVLSRLRTDEHATPQDGRFTFASRNTSADIRVSIAPTYFGENAVLRLLSNRMTGYTLETLGFSLDDREKIRTSAGKSSGLILCTGPTGAGKTTTLYSLLKLINTQEISVVTIEDPIECALENVEQIQVNPRAGLTFAQGLRSILRQDPNVILVGEIRDAETAGIAVNMALTGHLVLSTLHTPDASTALIRLLDLKIERFLVASTVSLIIGQRLVRRVCDSCRMEDKEAKEKLIDERSFDSEVRAERGSGCEACSHSGFKGRTVVSETLLIDEKMREVIQKNASAGSIRKTAIASGMKTILEDGLEKVLSGLTAYSEVMRVIHE